MGDLVIFCFYCYNNNLRGNSLLINFNLKYFNEDEEILKAVSIKVSC